MNAPKRIWVDSCKDADGEPEWDTGAWGHDQQEGDEEYVRADLFAKAVEALELIAGVKGPYSRPFPEVHEGYGAFVVVKSREVLTELEKTE